MLETSLIQEHRALGAKLVPFADWLMPIQYTGIIDEHQAVRKQAGLFDVSHMGEIVIQGPEALRAVQYLTTNDAAKLPAGKAQYSLLCTPTGTLIDDIIVYRRGENDFLICVNASNVKKDFTWMQKHAQEKKFKIDLRDESQNFALLALQGPEAPVILQKLVDFDLATLSAFHFRNSRLPFLQNSIMISRTGYTGEDGFEIYTSWGEAPKLWSKLLATGQSHGLKPAGLGARDTLRLEMKYALYGNDIDAEHTALEAGLGWVVHLDKGEFIGHEALAKEKERGSKRKLIGFKMTEPGVPRHGYPILINAKRVGDITSGSYGPSVDCGIGLAYMPIEYSSVGQPLEIEIRGKRFQAKVSPTPFYQPKKR